MQTFDLLVDQLERNPSWPQKSSPLSYLLISEFKKQKEFFISAENVPMQEQIKDARLLSLLQEYCDRNKFCLDNAFDPIQNLIGKWVNGANEPVPYTEYNDYLGRKKWSSGKGEQWWKSSSLKERFKMGIDLIHEPTKTRIGANSVQLGDLSLIDDNDKYFLSSFKQDDRGEFLYLIWNNKNGVVKLGRTRTPWVRAKAHLTHWEKYSASDPQDISASFSRNSFPSGQRFEDLLLKKFGEILGKEPHRGNEFFLSDGLCSTEEQHKIAEDIFAYLRKPIELIKEVG